MSNPHEHHNGGRRGREARSRRPGQPSAPTRRTKRRATSICRQERQLANPDHEAFVAWFVAYWRRRGSDLFADHTLTKETRIEA
jgi:hypothetical protein